MTNDLQFISYIPRNPLDPMIMRLTAVWFISICISLISLLAAFIQIARHKSVRVLSQLFILTAAILGLSAIAMLIWMSQRVCDIQQTANTVSFGPQMMAHYWGTEIYFTAVSVILIGIHLTIGIVLNRKWKKPQPTAAASPPLDR